MENFRALYRFIIFLISSLLMLFIFCLGLPFTMKNRNYKMQWKNRLISHWAALMARLMGLSMEIKGNPPEPPFFMISNHLSYIDILPFWKHLKTTFVAKSEIKKWPFFGQAARLLGIIFINRENRKDLNRVNISIEENINKQQGVILFPEGTSSKGEDVLPFKSSLLYYPAVQKLPVYYASISYNIIDDNAKEAWKEVCWWGDMDFFSHFWGLLKIKSWKVTVHFGKAPIINQDRKKLTQALYEGVKQNFEPTFSK